MSSTISATSTAPTVDALFTKLDTKKKGYIDAADLKTAAGATEADDAKAAEAFKRIDADSDGKVTKSELSGQSTK
jgi:Ca2+-binding EF-hand superfamily protein